MAPGRGAGGVNIFNPISHQYEISGRRVPSVTQVLRDLIPGWQASEWHLQRGQAVHACCAMIARGQAFTNDPQIDGQVQAARLWFAHAKPVIRIVEKPMFSTRYGFAGTPDLIIEDKGKTIVVDFKPSLTDSLPYQLGAYALLYAEHDATMPKEGYGVELQDDGLLRISKQYELKRYARRFLSLLDAYNIRRECKMKEADNAS